MTNERKMLFSLAKKYSERTLLLVPTTEEYSSATDRLAQQLETQFIITDIDSLFDCPPIKDIMS